MTRDVRLDELAALDAVGALPDVDAARLRTALETAAPEDRQDAIAYREVAAALRFAGPLVDGALSEVRARLMARVVGSDRVDDPPPGFAFCDSGGGAWWPHLIPGIRYKQLSANPEGGYVTLLVEADAGARLPSHHHSASEDCYVLSGDLNVFGRRLGPGDFHHADADSHHGELYTEGGCRVLLIVAPQDFLPGPWPAQP